MVAQRIRAKVSIPLIRSMLARLWLASEFILKGSQLIGYEKDIKDLAFILKIIVRIIILKQVTLIWLTPSFSAPVIWMPILRQAWMIMGAAQPQVHGKYQSAFIIAVIFIVSK